MKIVEKIKTFIKRTISKNNPVEIETVVADNRSDDRVIYIGFNDPFKWILNHADEFKFISNIINPLSTDGLAEKHYKIAIDTDNPVLFAGNENIVLFDRIRYIESETIDNTRFRYIYILYLKDVYKELLILEKEYPYILRMISQNVPMEALVSEYITTLNSAYTRDIDISDYLRGVKSNTKGIMVGYFQDIFEHTNCNNTVVTLCVSISILNILDDYIGINHYTTTFINNNELVVVNVLYNDLWMFRDAINRKLKDNDISFDLDWIIRYIGGKID